MISDRPIGYIIRIAERPPQEGEPGGANTDQIDFSLGDPSRTFEIALVSVITGNQAGQLRDGLVKFSNRSDRHRKAMTEGIAGDSRLAGRRPWAGAYFALRRLA